MYVVSLSELFHHVNKPITVIVLLILMCLWGYCWYKFILMPFANKDKKRKEKELENKLGSTIENYMDSVDPNDLSPEARKKLEAYKQGGKIEIEIED